MKFNYWCIENDLGGLVPPWEGRLGVVGCVFGSDRVLYPIKQGIKPVTLINWMGSGIPEVFDSEADAKDAYIQSEGARILKAFRNLMANRKALLEFMV